MIADPPPEQVAAFGADKMMLMMEPPAHTAFRKLIRAEFSAPAARLRADRMAELAGRIVDEVIEAGECDFVARVAAGFELAGPPRWLESNFISGPKAMPLRFTPGRRRACRACA